MGTQVALDMRRVSPAGSEHTVFLPYRLSGWTGPHGSSLQPVLLPPQSDAPGPHTPVRSSSFQSLLKPLHEACPDTPTPRQSWGSPVLSLQGSPSPGLLCPAPNYDMLSHRHVILLLLLD